MPVDFRNVDGSQSDDVGDWPYEGLVEVIDRGLVGDWQPVIAEVRRSPWGKTALRLDHYLTYREQDAVSILFTEIIDRARVKADAERQAEVAARVRAMGIASGSTKAELARAAGISSARLGAYMSGKIIPSAAMLREIDRAAKMRAEHNKRREEYAKMREHKRQEQRGKRQGQRGKRQGQRGKRQGQRGKRQGQHTKRQEQRGKRQEQRK